MKKRITLMLYAIFCILVTTNSLKAKTKPIDNLLAKLEQVGYYAGSINDYFTQNEQIQLNAHLSKKLDKRYLSAKNIERASGTATWFAINNTNEFNTFDISDFSNVSAIGISPISAGVFENSRAINPAEPSKAWASSAFTNATNCNGPSTVNVDNITSSSADLSWDAEATAALGYEWVVMPADVPPVIDGSTEVATGTTDSTTLMDTVSGLDDTTFYDVYVRSLCSINETSDWSIQNVFITPIANDNFEDAVAVACGGNYTGNTGFATPDGDSSSPNVWFSFTGSGVAEIVTLSLCNSEFSFDTVIRLYTGTFGDLTQIDIDDNDSCPLATQFFQSQLTFTSDGSTTYYISVGGSFSSEVGNYDLDVTCVDAPICNAPENLSIANVTLSGADLSWDAEATADDGYQWVVMPSGVLPVLDGSTEVATDTTDSSTTEDSVTGLSSGTSYDAYVRSLCSTSETSDWSEVANFTLIQSQIIYIVNTTDDTADADLSDSSCEDVNGNCSLRAAIENANKTSNKDSIEFNLSGTTPFVFEITTGVLPPIQEPAVLDGRTQPGYIDTPLIEIDGTLLGPGNNGIQFTGGADGSEMYGLAIGGFQEQDVTPFDLGFGVFVNSVDNLTIESNYIGLRSDGNTLFTNTGFGMLFNNSSNNTVGGTGPNEGNLISGNFSGGLTFEGGGNNLIQGNLIGTDVTGTLNRGNKFNVQLIDSSNNIIGGSTPEERNIVSGGKNQLGDSTDGTGFSIVGASATGNKVYGNYIGTDISGTQSIPNLRGGVLLLFGANNNEIGGLNPGEGNVISGNGQYGIYFQGTDVSPVTNNMIQGNKIGTDESGDIALPNQIGIASLVGDNTFDNSIGGDVPEAKNTISGNSVTGIAILSGTNNTIQGNYIGTNSNGDNAVPNPIGISIGDSANIVGGTTSGAGNLISGNSDTNLSLEDDAGGTIVQGNLIGTGNLGINALSSNPGNGIEFTNSISTTTPIIIGGSETGRNIISGNDTGILVRGQNHDISYNYIGLSASGNASLPNQKGTTALGDLSGTEIHHNTISGNEASSGSSRNLELANASNLKVSSNIIGLQADGLNTVSDNSASGITIQNSSNNVIGGSTEAEGNIISGNGLSGVSMVFSSNNNIFENNLIGIASDGVTERNNGLNGIIIDGNINSALILNNTIANNNASGIAFSENIGTPAGVEISQNSIFNNSSKGISLSNNSSNDPNDADSGPNNLQNYPEITALNDLGNGDIQISYSVPSVAPNSTYPLSVEFFGAVSGQGKTYLATDTYASPGSKSFTATIPSGTNQIDFEFIVGTATDSDGNTSEFSLESTLDVTDFNMNSISIYPNPTTDLLNIVFEQEAEYNMSVYDIQGRLIIDQKSNAAKDHIDVSALDKGIYILSIESQSGLQNHMKFIKN